MNKYFALMTSKRCKYLEKISYDNKSLVPRALLMTLEVVNVFVFARQRYVFVYGVYLARNATLQELVFVHMLHGLYAPQS